MLDLIVPAGQRGLDRARGLPAARRQRAVRLRGDALLARHRHPRALPAGHVRHPRGRASDARRRAAGERLPVDRAEGARSSGRVVPPGARRRGCRDRRGRARRRPRACSGAASGRRGSHVERASCCDGAEIGAGLHAARLHRRGRRADRRRTPRRRARRARRGRDDRRRQRRHARGAGMFPRRELPDGGDQVLHERLDRARPRGGRGGRRHRPARPTSSAMPEHLRDALWRVESAKLEPRRRARRPGRRRHGRLGDRRRAGARGARRPRLAPDLRGARLRPAGLDDARHHRALRELLGRHRGDARRLRGGRRARRAAASS